MPRIIRLLRQAETTHFGLFAIALTALLCLGIGLSVELHS